MTTQAIAILEPGYAHYTAERDVLAAHDVQIAPIGEHEEAIPSLHALDPVAILVRERTVDAAEIDACPNLKIIVRYGVGVDNINLEYARSKNVHVANVPDYGAENEVSEHALALYLAVQRRLMTRDHEVRDGKWNIGQAAKIPNRENAVLGLIGCGRIGLAAADKFRAMGFGRVLAFDPFLSLVDATTAKVEPTDINQLCATADVISLHAPLTDKTHHILNAKRIGMMKPSSIVVNVSRGGLLDEAALATALHQGRLFGAGIDVFEQEPIAPDNPLLAAPNVILSDHTAWYSERSVTVLQQNAAREIQRVLAGRTPKNWMNAW